MKRNFFLIAVLSCTVVLLLSCVGNFKGIFDKRSASDSVNPYARIGQIHNQGLEYVYNMIAKDETGSVSSVDVFNVSGYVSEFVNTVYPDSDTRTENAENVRISGTIISSVDGYPIPGATVSVVGSTSGIVADVEGEYSLNVPVNSVVLVSFVGYNQKIYAILGNADRVLNIALDPRSEESGNGTVITSSLAWQPASDVGINTSRGEYYYEKLGDILHDYSLPEDIFVNKIAKLENDIMSDTQIDEETKNALLCGTSTAVESLDYWRANTVLWSMLTHTSVPNNNDRRITGVVIDRNTGESIVGANIIVTGTTIGTLSDVDGRYELYVPVGYHEMRCSFIGYDTEVVSIASSRTNINIFMSETGALGRDVLKVVAADVLGAVGGYITGGYAGAAEGAITASAEMGLSL